VSLLASIRERRTVGQLADELESTRARSILLQDAASMLVACVKALALDIPELDTSKLKTALDETLGRVRAEAPPEELLDELRRRQRETMIFADKERRYLEDRDAEMRHIIGVLTDGLAEVGHGNATYDKTILEKGARFEAAAQLGDIVKIRQVIAREVQDLRKAVAEKHAQDAAHTAALTREVEALRKDVEKARTAAATDPLTGAANRAAFDGEVARLCDLAASGAESFALLMVDVDHFKSINDAHGHPVGDRVLMALVGFCREHVRRGDMVARWGGEEFAVLLPSASLRVAHAKGAKMVKELGKRKWGIDAKGQIGFTVSMGAAAWAKGDDANALVTRADQALYKAKKTGRNKIVKAA
jgi:diguanylate cyclase (GGDEF)-like protein